MGGEGIVTTELPAEIEDILEAAEPRAADHEPAMAAERRTMELPIYERLGRWAERIVCNSSSPRKQCLAILAIGALAFDCGRIYGRLEAAGPPPPAGGGP